MNDEHMRILKMIEEGKLSAEEGAELMKAVGEDEAEEAALSKKSSSWKGKKLRIQVTDVDKGKDRVNIRIPLSLAKLAEKFIPKDAKAEMQDQGFDIDTILSSIDEVSEGPIVDIDPEDTKENVKVLIYIE